MTLSSSTSLISRIASYSAREIAFFYKDTCRTPAGLTGDGLWSVPRYCVHISAKSCIFDAKYKFRTILLQIIWALVSTATLNPFELRVIYFEKTSQKVG